MNRPYYQQKPEDKELNSILNDEKNLNAAFYNRMSGVIQWQPGERQEFEERFARLSAKIKRLMNEKAAREFASLPE